MTDPTTPAGDVLAAARRLDDGEYNLSNETEAELFSQHIGLVCDFAIKALAHPAPQGSDQGEAVERLREAVAELYDDGPDVRSPDAAGSASAIGFGRGAAAGWDAAIKRVLSLPALTAQPAPAISEQTGARDADQSI